MASQKKVKGKKKKGRKKNKEKSRVFDGITIFLISCDGHDFATDSASKKQILLYLTDNAYVSMPLRTFPGQTMEEKKKNQTHYLTNLSEIL